MKRKHKGSWVTWNGFFLLRRENETRELLRSTIFPIILSLNDVIFRGVKSVLIERLEGLGRKNEEEVFFILDREGILGYVFFNQSTNEIRIHGEIDSEVIPVKELQRWLDKLQEIISIFTVSQINMLQRHEIIQEYSWIRRYEDARFTRRDST